MIQQKYELEAQSTLEVLKDWIESDPKGLCSFYEYCVCEIDGFDKIEENYYLEKNEKLFNSDIWQSFKNYLQDQIEMRIDCGFLKEYFYHESEEEFIFEWFDNFLQANGLYKIQKIIGDE